MAVLTALGHLWCNPKAVVLDDFGTILAVFMQQKERQSTKFEG